MFCGGDGKWIRKRRKISDIVVRDIIAFVAMDIVAMEIVAMDIVAMDIMIYYSTGSLQGSTGWQLVVLGQYGGDTGCNLLVLGQYNLVLIGIEWYWVNKGLLCLYILKKK